MNKQLHKIFNKDENPTPIASNVVASATDSSNTLRFGDGSGSDPYSAYYDWIIWTTDGAYSPKDLVIPADLKLTGVK